MCRYSGEEAGLRGSGDIAADYKKNNVQVKGMLQLDMTFMDASLTEFVGKLVRRHVHDLYVSTSVSLL